MNRQEWEHRMETLHYIESLAQHNTEKRLLEAVGYRNGWLERPALIPDWFTIARNHAHKLVKGDAIYALSGRLLLNFEDLERAIREDREWLPAALQAIQIRDDTTASKHLRNSMIGCAMKLVYSFRQQLDPKFKTRDMDREGEPEDEEFMEHITRGVETA